MKNYSRPVPSITGAGNFTTNVALAESSRVKGKRKQGAYTGPEKAKFGHKRQTFIRRGSSSSETLGEYRKRMNKREALGATIVIKGIAHEGEEEKAKLVPATTHELDSLASLMNNR